MSRCKKIVIIILFVGFVQADIWGDWSAYTTCSVSCGGGQRIRTRQCKTGNTCIGTNIEHEVCADIPCPINGGWSNFTQSDCSTSCGVGVAILYRTCTHPTPSHGGDNCTGPSHTFTQCQHTECPIDGGWAGWETWSSCSVTFGIGIKIRARNCTRPMPQYGGNYCVGDKSEIEFCAVNTWSPWSHWSVCDVTCGNGRIQRTRTCAENDCVGNSMETTICSLPSCPGADGYMSWSDWSVCTATCGNSISTRTRVCTSTSPLGCPGSSLDKRDCKLAECPVDGQYGHWSVWSDCSVTCGTGLMFRNRVCDSPLPQYGGHDCPGKFLDKRSCQQPDCPIDGGWSNYVNHSCSVSCGSGTMLSVRTCTEPIPQNGGKHCEGPVQKIFPCNEQPCVVDGGWGVYRVLHCSVTCGLGDQVEIRECNNPPPQHGGLDCIGLSHRITKCTMPSCGVDGGWTQWSVFSQCPSMCGDGYIVRNRTCSNPTPSNGGSDCQGDQEHRIGCNNGPCGPDTPICNKSQVLQNLADHHLYAPLRLSPCSNMNFIPQETMIHSACNAPLDYNTWKPKFDIARSCDSVPLYSPLLIKHRDFNTLEYGVVLDCHKGMLKYAIATCDSGVHEIDVEIEHQNQLDFFTMTW